MTIPIELTEQQRQAVEQGEPVRACLDGRNVVLLRNDILRQIQSNLNVERAVIAAGHTRGPIALPTRLEAINVPFAAPPDLVFLPGERFDEIQELVADDRERAAWVGAVGAAQAKWAKDNPY